MAKADKEAKLNVEYDNVFDGMEKMMHQFTKIKSTITVAQEEIDIEDIITSGFKKSSRKSTMTGLSAIVKELGVVTPIHVLAMEDDDCYLLLDGLRRLFAAAKAGKKKIVAVVWDFSDKREGKEFSNILSLMINRTQAYKPIEMWEQMKVLESVNEASPGLIEYLLQMNAGDAMKLKDVMLSDYDEFKDDLITGKYSIEQAYKKLCNERKKEDKLDKEDKMAIGVGEILDSTSSESGEGSVSEDEGMSNREAKSFLDLAPSESDDDDFSVGDSDEPVKDLTDKIREKEMHQKVGERTFVDPSVKKATLIRDENKCRCCGIGGPQWAGILVYHHVIPVYAGGEDTVENGLTLCVNCHLTLHNYITGDVQFGATEVDEEQEEIFNNIKKYGNMALNASKGMDRKKLKEANKGSKKHPMPKENVKINKEALSAVEESAVEESADEKE